tara:strand:- start:1699 stop:1938 length:240 start_codon:yes stop_codon:yes gene_type:complete
MINNVLFFYRNYNYLYYGLSLYYTISVSYNTYYYCKLVYNYIPLIKYDNNQNNENIEIILDEVNSDDLCEKWTIIEKKN